MTRSYKDTPADRLYRRPRRLPHLHQHWLARMIAEGRAGEEPTAPAGGARGPAKSEPGPPAARFRPGNDHVHVPPGQRVGFFQQTIRLSRPRGVAQVKLEPSTLTSTIWLRLLILIAFCGEHGEIGHSAARDVGRLDG